MMAVMGAPGPSSSAAASLSSSASSSASSTTVKVAVRIRPLNAKEVLANSKECIRVIPQQNQVIVGQIDPGNLSSQTATKSFTFDAVFGVDSTQIEVYRECVGPLVQRFLEGFNSTTLAYGQTGSGKTWSMGTGLDNGIQTHENHGIVPRAIRDMFNQLQSKKEEYGDGFEWAVFVSFLELYNEDLVDLLNPRPKSAGSSNNGPTVREDAHGNIVWSGIKEEEVKSPEELMSCLQRGSLCRTTGSTDMNASSSRSHAIFSVILKQQIWTTQTTDSVSTATISDPSSSNTITDIQDLQVSPTENPNGFWRNLSSKFHFVDLAGSERLKRTNAEGDRKKEGISINQGLLALGNVISALGDESRKGSHVPYRDSKLTRMLQDSLGGNSQTLMIACVSPSDLSYGESVNTLTYANRARNIRNRAVVNQEFGGLSSAAAEKEIQALRSLVAELKEENTALRMASGNSVNFVAGTRLRSYGGDDGDSGASRAREREIQLQLQDQREMMKAVDDAKAEARFSKFEAERFGFRANRLQDRVKGLSDELSACLIERDQALLELVRLKSEKTKANTSLSNVNSNSPIKTSPVNENISESPGTPNSKKHESKEISALSIASYQRTISELKFRLSEAQDRLAWYDEVVAELGKEKKSFTEDVKFDPSLDVPSVSQFKKLVSEETSPVDIAHEKRLLKALKDDVDFEKVIDETPEKDESNTTMDESQPPLFGLPSVSTASFKPSNLSQAVDNSQEDDDEEYEDEPEDDDMCTSDNENECDAPAHTTKSEDRYLIIHRLQSEISDHQMIMDRLNRREQEYEAMRNAFESKMQMLQSQVASVARERDEAIKRIKEAPGAANSKGGSEKVGTAAVKARYDDQKRKLEAQIADYKRKLSEAARANTRSRNDALTKQLMSTIESLKADKAKALKELKKEAEKARELKNIKEIEIARLRRKEKAAAELAKKLERSNQLQRMILNRRSEDSVKSHKKFKNVMTALKRTIPSTSGNTGKIRKQTGMVSPNVKYNPHSRNQRRGSTTPPDEILHQALRLGFNRGGIDAVQKAPSTMKAKFKKQMIDKELASVVTFRLAEMELNLLKSARDRLLGEQRELLAERERCVQADYERTGLWEPHQPQYMDERLGVIDLEVSMANTRIRNSEEEIRLGRMAAAAMNSSSSPTSPRCSLSEGDLGMENAFNLIRSLDQAELEHVATLFMEDLIQIQIQNKSIETKLLDQEKSSGDLRKALETMRGAAIQTAVEYRKELEKVKQECIQKVADMTTLLSSSTSPDASTQQENYRSTDLRSTLLQRTGLNIPMSPQTPRIQKLFDAAYGQGVVDVSAAVKNSMKSSLLESKFNESQNVKKVVSAAQDVDDVDEVSRIESKTAKRTSQSEEVNQSRVPSSVVSDPKSPFAPTNDNREGDQTINEIEQSCHVSHMHQDTPRSTGSLIGSPNVRESPSFKFSTPSRRVSSASASPKLMAFAARHEQMQQQAQPIQEQQQQQQIEVNSNNRQDVEKDITKSSGKREPYQDDMDIDMDEDTNDMSPLSQKTSNIPPPPPLKADMPKIEISQKLMMFSRGFKAGMSGAVMPSRGGEESDQTVFSRGVKTAISSSQSTSPVTTHNSSTHFSHTSSESITSLNAPSNTRSISPTNPRHHDIQSHTSTAPITTAASTTQHTSTRALKRPLFKSMPVIPAMPIGSPTSPDVEDISSLAMKPRIPSSSSTTTTSSSFTPSASSTSTTLSSQHGSNDIHPTAKWMPRKISAPVHSMTLREGGMVGGDVSSDVASGGSHHESLSVRRGVYGKEGVQQQEGLGDGDVFLRLATSHTMASQAKIRHNEHE